MLSAHDAEIRSLLFQRNPKRTNANWNLERGVSVSINPKHKHSVTYDKIHGADTHTVCARHTMGHGLSRNRCNGLDCLFIYRIHTSRDVYFHILVPAKIAINFKFLFFDSVKSVERASEQQWYTVSSPFPSSHLQRIFLFALFVQ